MNKNKVLGSILYYLALFSHALFLAPPSLAVSIKGKPAYSNVDVVDNNGSMDPSKEITWTEWTKAYESDNNYAQVTLAPGQTSKALEVTKFNLNIPTNTAITGIKVDIEKSAIGDVTGPAKDSYVQLLVDGNPVGEKRHTLYQNIDVSGDFVSSYGGGSDNWGYNFTPEIINSQKFGVQYVVERPAGGSNVQVVRVDQITVVINPSSPSTAKLTKIYSTYPDGVYGFQNIIEVRAVFDKPIRPDSYFGLMLNTIGVVNMQFHSNNEIVGYYITNLSESNFKGFPITEPKLKALWFSPTKEWMPPQVFDIDNLVVNIPIGDQSAMPTDNFLTNNIVVDTLSPNTPIQLSPIDAYYNENNTGIGLLWTPVEDNLPSTFEESAVHYKWQIAKNPNGLCDFSSDIFQTSVTTDTKHITNIYDPGNYCWRVQACDFLSNCSQWSPNAYFDVVSGNTP